MPRTEKKNTRNVSVFDITTLLSVGNDVFISPYVEIRRPQLVRVGNHVAIDSGFYLTAAADIGDYIHIGPSVTVIGGEKGKLSIHDFVTIAMGTRILCGSDDFNGGGLVTAPGIPPEFTNVKHAPVVVEDFANICTNAVILPGVTLREGSVVGACSLVTRDTEPWTIYMGTPARPVKKRPKEKMIEYARILGYR